MIKWFPWWGRHSLELEASVQAGTVALNAAMGSMGGGGGHDPALYRSMFFEWSIFRYLLRCPGCRKD